MQTIISKRVILGAQFFVCIFLNSRDKLSKHVEILSERIKRMNDQYKNKMTVFVGVSFQISQNTQFGLVVFLKLLNCQKLGSLKTNKNLIKFFFQLEKQNKHQKYLKFFSENGKILITAKQNPFDLSGALSVQFLTIQTVNFEKKKLRSIRKSFGF